VNVASLLQLLGVLIVIGAAFTVSAVAGTVLVGVAVFAVGAIIEARR
jgi:hypothetical protein